MSTDLTALMTDPDLCAEKDDFRDAYLRALDDVTPSAPAARDGDRFVEFDDEYRDGA